MKNHLWFPALDVLRGFAILQVVLWHLPNDVRNSLPFLFQFQGGRGVDLFFSLSGFLIGLSIANSNSVGLKACLAFLKNRIARVWPMHYIVLLIYALGIIPFVNYKEISETLLTHPWRYFTFFANTIFQPSLELGVLWSLSIEEQFYLIISVLLLTRIATLKNLSICAALTVVLSQVYTLYLAHRFSSGAINHDHYITQINFSSIARAGHIGLAFVAGLNYFTYRKFLPNLSFAPLVVITLLFFYLPLPSHYDKLLLSFLFAGVVLLATSCRYKMNFFYRLISSLGLVSYSLYLLHPIVRSYIVTIDQNAFRNHIYLSTSSYIVGSILIAWFAYHFIENKLRLKIKNLDIQKYTNIFTRQPNNKVEEKNV